MKGTSTTALALILAAATSPALAQASWTFSDIDSDGNLELSRSELEAFGRQVFIAWDSDADQQIGEDEFYSGVYDTWDLDEDASLTEAEYQDGWAAWFGDMDQASYVDLDTDANAGLSEEEFASGLATAGIYDSYADGTTFGEEEFTTIIHDAYDVDNDEVITQAEYDRIDLYGTQTAQLAGADSEVVTGASGSGTIETTVVSLDEWAYDDLYSAGTSADTVLGTPVYGISGEELGEVEDLIIGPEGQILAAIAEVGGFIDIGDTHVSLPWGEVEVSEGGEGLVVPLTEETVGEYDMFETDWITATDAASEVISEVDGAETGPRAWRLRELIGDYVRLSGQGAALNYGYVSDVVLRDGEIAAVVVEPSAAYGGGYRAFPYFGYGYGWTPGAAYYDLPYGETEVSGMEAFDYEGFGAM